MQRLDPITKPQKQKPYAVCDIETMDWVKFIVIGHTNNGQDFEQFRVLHRYFEYLEKTPDLPKTIYAHFGGKFDFLFLIKGLLKNDRYKILSIVPRGSSILYFDCALGGHTYTFRDSSALLPFGLKSISENFGTDIQKTQWDHTKTRGYSAELAEYLKSDCHSLHQSLDRFFTWPLIQKAGSASTLASQSMRVLRTYLKKPLYALDASSDDYCRRAYLGGRTEIFKPFCKKGPLYEYDVNSLYPYVMSENEFPIGNGTLCFEYNPKKLGIYKVKVIAPEMHIPVLGIIHKEKYIFPTGRFTGVFTSVEIEYARTLGYKFKVINGVFFNQKSNLFRDFIKDLYSIRISSPKNSVSDIIAKLLMNSSYGRFGLNPEKENIGFDLKEGVNEYATLEIRKKKIQLFKEPLELETFTHTGIAAFVTSYARIHMHRLYQQCGEDLYYTDTDSLFTTRKLENGKSLGALKLEHEWESACFLLPKTYMAQSVSRTKRSMKGFQKSKIENFEMIDFQNGLEGDLRRFKIENEPKFATLKQAIAQKKLVTMTKASTKQLKAKYNKRVVYKENGELLTRAIALEE